MLSQIPLIRYHLNKNPQIYQGGCNNFNKKVLKTYTASQKPVNLSSILIWRLNQSVGHKHPRFKILIHEDRVKLVKICQQHMQISNCRCILWFKIRSTKPKTRRMNVSKPYLACPAPRKRIQINKITNLDQAETPTGKTRAMLNELQTMHKVQQTP